MLRHFNRRRAVNIKDMGHSEQSISKEGIKNDNFMNRRKAGRVDGEKGAKRTYTTKSPPAKLVPFSCAFAWTLAKASICHPRPVVSGTTTKNKALPKSVDVW